MRILILGPADNPHIIKWVRALSEKNIEIALFSLNGSVKNYYKDYTRVKVYSLNLLGNKIKTTSLINKLQYLRTVNLIKKIIKEFKPNIVHAHYASSYGLLGVLSGFHPLIISVWGSDIYKFPNRNFMTKLVLKYNLKKADCILSTSYAMKEETQKYTSKNILITPFGVDLNIFKPVNLTLDDDKKDIVIGIIKSLEAIYGIEFLIKAFAILKNKYKNLPLKLLIVGDGSLRRELEELVENLDIKNLVYFTGRISYDKISKYHNMVDIAVYPSESESFGVAVIEAGACEKPVIVSNVGGLPEVVENGKTGFVVKYGDINAIVNALERLILDKQLRKNMGKNARKRIMKLYDWKNSVKLMLKIYENLVKGKSKCAQ